MRTNKKESTESTTLKTHEGAPASKISNLQILKRITACCFLGEDLFYETGKKVKDKIYELAQELGGKTVKDWAIEVRSKWHMRHAPLMLVLGILKENPEYAAEAIAGVIQRPDEMAELVSLYWGIPGNKKMIPRQMKKGLEKAFRKFKPETLAKWDFNNSAVKLRDVLFMIHLKPKDKEEEKLFKRLIGGYCEKCWEQEKNHTKKTAHKFKEAKLPTPETWEVRLSSGEDKKKVFTELIKDEELGGLALLRNLRNMNEAGVNKKLVRAAIEEMKTDRILPFRFIAAAKYAPEYEQELESAMKRSMVAGKKLKGRTAFLIDVSGSMNEALSEKSELRRYEAGYGLAMVLRWACEKVDIYAFDTTVKEVPPREGFALRDAIDAVNTHGGTDIGLAVRYAQAKDQYDRIIVITDEQSDSPVGNTTIKKAYMVNVSSYQNGIAYRGNWTHITGFSEGVLNFIRETEDLD